MSRIIDKQKEVVALEKDIALAELSVVPVNVFIERNHVKAEELIRNILGSKEEILCHYFFSHLLGNNASLVLVRNAEGIESPGVLAFDRYADIAIILPIQTATVDYKIDDCYFQGLQEEMWTMKLRFSDALYMNSNGQIVKFEGPEYIPAEHKAKGKQAIRHYDPDTFPGEPPNDMGFKGGENEFFDGRPASILKYKLPISGDTVKASLHEQGHRIDWVLAANEVKFSLLMQLLESGHLISKIELDEPTQQMLEKHRGAEIRAWIYAGMLMESITGKKVDILKDPDCIMSLSTYDLFAATYIVGAGPEMESRIFIFPHSMKLTEQYINTFTTFREYLEQLLALGNTDLVVLNIDEIKISISTRYILISADDTELVIYQSNKEHEAELYQVTISKKFYKQSGEAYTVSKMFDMNYNYVDLNADVIEMAIEVMAYLCPIIRRLKREL